MICLFLFFIFIMLLSAARKRLPRFPLRFYIPGVQTQDGSKSKWFGTLFHLGQLQGQFGHLYLFKQNAFAGSGLCIEYNP